MNISTFILFLFFSLTCRAQKTLPSKEQTIDFITNFFNDHTTLNDLGGDNIGEGSKGYVFQIKDSIVSLAYSDRAFYVGDKKFKTVRWDFNIKDIQSVIGVTKGGLPPCNSVVLFSSFNKKKVLSLTVDGVTEKTSILGFPLIGYSSENCGSNVENSQIIKAFNHLRKLFGAPEPIRFD